MLRTNNKFNTPSESLIWMGCVPEDWEIKRIQECLYEINQSNSPVVTDNILSLTNTDGVIPYNERGNQGNKAKEDLEAYKVVYENTIVANSMNILIGSVGLSKYKGCVSPVYYVYAAKEGYDVRFFNYLMRTTQFQKELRKYANGIMEIRMRVSSGDILKRKAAVPSVQEQSEIADFLDVKCEQIDDLLREEKSILAKLKDLKKAYISEALTHGIDGVSLKESNLSYVDGIPENWENRKMISLLAMRVVDGAHESPVLLDDGIPYISATAIENGRINFDKRRGFISEEYCDICDQRYKPQIGDILVIKLGASTGQVAIVDTDERFNIWVPLAAVRCNDSALPKFVYYAFQADYMIKQMELSWTFGTQETLGLKTIEGLRILIPSVSEQKRIVEYLDKKIEEVDSLILQKEKLIETIEVYEKSLIFDLVTGKRKVV